MKIVASLFIFSHFHRVEMRFSLISSQVFTSDDNNNLIVSHLPEIARMHNLLVESMTLTQLYVANRRLTVHNDGMMR